MSDTKSSREMFLELLSGMSATDAAILLKEQAADIARIQAQAASERDARIVAFLSSYNTGTVASDTQEAVSGILTEISNEIAQFAAAENVQLAISYNDAKKTYELRVAPVPTPAQVPAGSRTVGRSRVAAFTVGGRNVAPVTVDGEEWPSYHAFATAHYGDTPNYCFNARTWLAARNHQVGLPTR